MKRIRKQKYAAVFEIIEIIQKFKNYADLRSYHNAFSAFFIAIKFYEIETFKLTTFKFKTIFFTSFPKLHRNFFFRILNLRELNSHPFKKKFKKSMKMKKKT